MERQNNSKHFFHGHQPPAARLFFQDMKFFWQSDSNRHFRLSGNGRQAAGRLFLLLFGQLISIQLVNGQTTTNYSNNTSGSIPDNGCLLNNVLTRTFTVTGNAVITDVNLSFNVSHASRGDLNVRLTSPTGTTVLIAAASSDANDNYDVVLDSDNANPLNDGNIDDVAAPYYDRTAAPSNSLNAFDGQNPAGTWTLTICDEITQFAGTFNRAQLTLTTVPGSGSSCTGFSFLCLNYGNSTTSRFDGATGAYINSPVATGLSNPNGAYQLNTGEVLICNGGNNTVMKYNPYTGASLGTFISAAAGGLQFPEQIKLGPDGYLYIVAQTNSVVKKFNYTTGALIGTVSSSANGLNLPVGLAFIGTDMYVTNSVSGGDLRKYNYLTGAYVSTLYDYPSGETPRGLENGPDGNLYVNVKTSTGARVDKFTMPAGTKSTFATLDAGSNPYAGIKWGPDGKLYIADYGENEVQRFTSAGTQDLLINTNLNGPHFVVFIGCSMQSIITYPVDAGCGLSNGSIDATISGGVAPFTYLWSNGATTQDLTGLAAGTYTLTVTDWGGVTAVASATVSNNNITSITATNVVCSNNGTPLNALDDTYTTDIVVAFSGKPSTGTLNLTGAATASVAVTATTSNSSHTFSGIVLPADGLPKSLTATFSAQPTCTMTSSATAVAHCSACTLGANAGADKTICAGQSTTIGAASVAGYSYVWSPTTGLSSSTISNPTASPTTTTTYTVTVSNSTGCSQTDAVLVTVNPSSTVVTAGANTPCLGSSLNLTATASGGVAPYSYAWTGPQNFTSSAQNPSFTAWFAAMAGTYSVVATDSNGCPNLSGGSVSVTIQTSPGKPGAISY